MEAQVNQSEKVRIELFYSIWYEDAFRSFLQINKCDNSWQSGYSYTSYKVEKGTYFQITIEPFDIWTMAVKWTAYMKAHDL